MVYFKQLCSLRLLVISGAGFWDAWSAMSWGCFVAGDWIHVFSHRLFKCLDCLIFQPWPTLTPPPNHTLPNQNEVVQDTFPYLRHCLICFFSFSPISLPIVLFFLLLFHLLILIFLLLPLSSSSTYLFRWPYYRHIHWGDLRSRYSTPQTLSTNQIHRMCVRRHGVLLTIWVCSGKYLSISVKLTWL